VHADPDLVVGLRDATELVDEVHVPRGATELPVRGRLQPDLLLHRDDVPDRGVLLGTQPVGVECACREPLPRGEERRRAQEAPDVVGAEWRFGASIGTSLHARNVAPHGRRAQTVPR
jgi:hypothetical protein